MKLTPVGLCQISWNWHQLVFVKYHKTDINFYTLFPHTWEKTKLLFPCIFISDGEQNSVRAGEGWIFYIVMEMWHLVWKMSLNGTKLPWKQDLRDQNSQLWRLCYHHRPQPSLVTHAHTLLIYRGLLYLICFCVMYWRAWRTGSGCVCNTEWY